MPATPTAQLITRYFEAFNGTNWEGMLDCLADDVVHDVNQGSRREGKAAFRAFLGRMAEAYEEQLEGIVVMVNTDGTRAAAEFNVVGTYLEAEEGLPPAHGQSYRLPGGAFFVVKDGRIARVTTYYNLTDWLTQVVTDDAPAGAP